MHLLRHLRYPFRLPAILSLLVIAMSPGFAAEPVSPEGMFIVDGQPRFIVGLYETVDDEALLGRIADAGFLLMNTPNKTGLDRLAAHGMKGWIQTGNPIDLSADTEARRSELTAMVEAHRTHPALLFWEGPDEALWNNSYPFADQLYNQTFPALADAAAALDAKDRPRAEALLARAEHQFQTMLWPEMDATLAELTALLGPSTAVPALGDVPRNVERMADGFAQGIGLIHQLDSAHLVWLNHAPRNTLADLTRFSAPADTIGCDIYPVPEKYPVFHNDLPAFGLASVGAFTDRMRAAAPGKPVIMVLQGFGWRDINEGIAATDPEEKLGIGRRPTWQETRFMAWDAIAHGASAILYWGTAYIPKESEHFADLLNMARELRALEPALVAPDIKPPSVEVLHAVNSVEPSMIRPLLRQVGDDFVLAVVNESPGSARLRIGGLPAALDGRTLHRLDEAGEAVVADSAIEFGIPATCAALFATNQSFAPELVPFTPVSE